MRNKAAQAPRSVLVTVLVAAVVTAGVLIAVAALRSRADTPVVAGPGADWSGGVTPPNSNCGTAACAKVASATVNGIEVALLAAPDGGSGRLRLGPEPANAAVETTITSIGARLAADSLRCADGTVIACLVRGVADGGLVGEVLTYRGDSWRGPEKPFFSDAGNISLSDATGDNSPDVIVVRHECPGSQPGSAKCRAAPVLASVFDLAGRLVGCTKKYTSPSDLRGWPDIRLTKADVRAC
jgi:hypothetical protein